MVNATQVVLIVVTLAGLALIGAITYFSVKTYKGLNAHRGGASTAQSAAEAAIEDAFKNNAAVKKAVQAAAGAAIDDAFKNNAAVAQGVQTATEAAIEEAFKNNASVTQALQDAFNSANGSS